MANVIVLGGCGAVGRVVVKTLVQADIFTGVTLADLDLGEATAAARQMASDKIQVTQVDALDQDSLRAALAGHDLVVNCVGPFYKTVLPIFDCVIDSRINYLDICDDVDVTAELLQRQGQARAAGLTMIIGLGNSPGVTNLLAKFAADHLFDETHAIDIYHAHGGEPVEGKGVIGHRFHCMQIDIPMFLEGRLQYVQFFEPEGRALRQTFNFPLLGDNIQVYPYPHPEQLTLPDHLPVQRVTNRGTILPSAYYELTRDICRLGLADKTPLEVNGQKISPFDFATAYLIRERDRLLEELDFGNQKGCTSTVIQGIKDGQPQEIRFHMASATQALGEGTGIPAAMGAILLQQGKMAGPGIFPPEGGLDPKDFLALIPDVLEKETAASGAETLLIMEWIDADGRKTTMDMLDAVKMI